MDEKTSAPPARIRALARGLAVLELLNEKPLATVSQIVAATGFPKASVIRILATLRLEGFIDLDDGGAGFRVLPKARLLSSALAIQDPSVGAIEQLLGDFSQAVKWPCEFLVPDGSAMAILASSREVSPITLKRFEQTRFPLLESATGIAYLSALEPEERARRIRSAADWQKTRANAIWRQVEAAVERCNARGFAERDYDAPIEGTRVAGLPVLAGAEPIGGIALIYLSEAVTGEQLRTVLLPRTRDVAGKIGEIWQTYRRGGEQRQ